MTELNGIEDREINDTLKSEPSTAIEFVECSHCGTKYPRGGFCSECEQSWPITGTIFFP